jgi:hypothetical protein
MAASLAHGWRLAPPVEMSAGDLREFIRPAVRAIPRRLADSLKPCSISFPADLDGGRSASRWEDAGEELRIAVAARGVTPHDAALELLTCVGQALWESSGRARREEWLRLVGGEIERGVEGEIDESALREKRRLLAGRTPARSAARLAAYAAASFAGTVAEYVHAQWHDVHLRKGARHLPASEVLRRFTVLRNWFPPNPGYRLFPWKTLVK